MHRSKESLSQSPSSQKLLPDATKNGAVKIEARKASYLEPKKHGLSARLSLFSQKIGVGEGLGLQEYMATVNDGQEDELQVWGYKLNRLRYFLTLVVVFLTGLAPLGLPLYWYRHWWLKCTREKCTLDEADSLLVVDHYKGLHTTHYVKTVYRRTRDQKDLVVPSSKGPGYRLVDDFRWFNCKKNRYYWDDQEAAFYKVEGLDRGITLEGLRQYEAGLTVEDGRRKAALYGSNEIVVPMENIGFLLVKEILSPFYVFQIFSICFWYADDYWMYATAILVMSVISLSLALYQTRTNQQKLRDTIVSSEMVVRLCADGTRQQVLSSELVPGDIIVVPDHGCQLLCDAVLLHGSVIMNESMLTGESVPVTKTPIVRGPGAEVEYSGRLHEKSTLKCGTLVIQTRKAGDQIVTAVVIRTGYSTSKGDLVRSILYPPPVDFQFEKDSYKFIMILAAIATVGMIYTLVKMVIDEETLKSIVLEVFDLITIVVPPALPAAMTIGTVIANQRLIPKNIYCISPRTINVAGTTDCVCFDKTGTITEDGMDMWGVLPVAAGLAPLQCHAMTVAQGEDSPVQWGDPVQDMSSLPSRCQLLLGMATCHELNIVGGNILGDPLDEKMFSSTGWGLELEGEELSQADRLQMPYMKSPVTQDQSVLQAAPLKLFPFSSDLQRMSVVTRIIEEQAEDFSQPSTYVFCKGSPEKVEAMCVPSSLPGDYRSQLNTYASHGYRIIAVAGRVMAPGLAKHSRLAKLCREQAEEDLVFLGLVVLENRLKGVSAAVLEELRGARIRTVMVTGDNILTAVSVARDCGLVPGEDMVIQVTAEVSAHGEASVHYTALTEQSLHTTDGSCTKLALDTKYHFAIEGPSFELVCDNFRTSLLPYLATRGAVFARMRPDMKQRLVEILQDLDYQVIMCGDGANDCGALKAANAGISLSEAEASVAAPFTSKTPDISCVPTLIRESRAALVTSFGIFKYMAAYSITQFVSVMILYDIYSNLSDFQFVYIDLFLITTMAAVFGFSRTYPGALAPQAPISSLFSALPVFSLLSQLSIVIGFQVFVLFYTRSQSWFVEFDYENACYRGTELEEVFNNTGLIQYWGETKTCQADEDPTASLENYCIFSISQFQYIILVIVFSKGAPYRETIFKNIPLVVDIIILASFSLLLTIQPEAWPSCMRYFMLFPPPGPLSYRLLLTAIVLANLFLSLFVELFLSDVLVRKVICRQDKTFEALDRELARRTDWPPLSGPQQEVVSRESDREDDGELGVIVTETDPARPSEQAFNSLFNTPDSSTHSAAAVSLNPPESTPRRQTEGHMHTSELLLSSPTKSLSTALPSPTKSFTTALPSPTDSPSPAVRFVSCDRLDSSPDLVIR